MLECFWRRFNAAMEVCVFRKISAALCAAAAAGAIGCHAPPQQAAIPANAGGNYESSQGPQKPLPESATNPPPASSGTQDNLPPVPPARPQGQ